MLMLEIRSFAYVDRRFRIDRSRKLGAAIAVEDADVLHTHPAHLQQIVCARLKDLRIDLQMRFDVFLREDGPACCNSTNQRQTQLLAKRIFQLDPARSTGNQINDAFALKRPQMLFSRVGGLESKRFGDFRPRRRHSRIRNGLLDQLQDFTLSGCQFAHRCVWMDGQYL